MLDILGSMLFLPHLVLLNVDQSLFTCYLPRPGLTDQMCECVFIVSLKCMVF